MVSDTMPGQPSSGGGSIDVCLDFDDANDMTSKFEALSAGGTVTTPLQDTFWGARFGTLSDAFGG
jgi:PhnB protein